MEGMGEIVATVSGYHGFERFKLIKLISLCGASYVGALTRSTTHLVCWKFEGEKYQHAKKFGIVILDHRWFEDCLKKGRRIPEQPYTQLSGQQLGAIEMEVPALSKEAGSWRENKLILNGVHKSSRDLVIDVEYENTEHHDWDDRWLLSKNVESTKNVSNPSRKQKKKIHNGGRDTTSAESSRKSRRLVKNKVDTSVGEECLGNKSFNSQENVASTSAEPSHKSRRLVKKNVDRCNSEPDTSVEEECLWDNRFDSQENVPITFFHSIVTNENEARMNEGSNDTSSGQRCTGNQATSETEITGVLDTGATIDANTQRADSSERNSQEIGLDMEDANAELKNADQIHQSDGTPSSMDLSCVICWTQFSSTRGVLPCGHRYCFSCIQNWADCMAAKGKASTCPLCKSAFMTITKVDDADCVDQKVYSQTVPCPSSTQDIFIVSDGPQRFDGLQTACCQCHSREPEDCLLTCEACGSSRIHHYCLDPPLFPWTCSRCRDLRRAFYPRF